jgi:hypothetical protein
MQIFIGFIRLDILYEYLAFPPRPSGEGWGEGNNIYSLFIILIYIKGSLQDDKMWVLSQESMFIGMIKLN